MRTISTLLILGFLASNIALASEYQQDGPGGKRFQKMPQVSNVPAAQKAFEAGAQAVITAKPQRAIMFFTMALASDKKAARVYESRAACYWKIDKADLALKDVETALSLDPTLDHPHHLRSDIYFDQHQPARALKEIDMACKLNPTYEPHIFQRGKLYEQQGLYEKALEDYRRCVQLNPPGTSAYFRRGNLLMTLGRYREAIPDYTNNINQKNAEDIETSYINRATCYDKIGKHDLAEKDRQKSKHMTETGWGEFMKSEHGR